MGYEKVKLGEVASIRGGKRLPAGKSFTTLGTAHPYIRARDIGGGTVEIHDPVFIDEATAQKLARYKAKRGDVCLTIVGANVGAMGVVPPHLDGANLTENAVRIFSNGRADQAFLKYALLSEDAMAQMKVLAGGAAQPKLGIYKIETIEFSLPPLPVQQRIASILSVYDELIENSQRRINTLESMARTLYREALKSQQYVVLPKPVVACKYWRFISENVGEYPETKCYYATADVDGLAITGSGINYSFSERPSRAQKQPLLHSVWFARMKDTHKIAWYGEANARQAEDSVLSSGFAGFEAREPELWPLLFLMISSKEFHVKKDLYCTGATQMSLTNEGLGRIEMCVPEEESARRLGRNVGPMLNAILTLQKKIGVLRRTRDLLMPRLLSGQIEVKESAA